MKKSRYLTGICVATIMLAVASPSAAPACGTFGTGRLTAFGGLQLEFASPQQAFRWKSVWKKIKSRIKKGIKIPLSPPGGWKF